MRKKIEIITLAALVVANALTWMIEPAQKTWTNALQYGAAAVAIVYMILKIIGKEEPV